MGLLMITKWYVNVTSMLDDCNIISMIEVTPLFVLLNIFIVKYFIATISYQYTDNT